MAEEGAVASSLMKKNFTTETVPLDTLRVFLAVARLGSFTRAADQLAVSASAVSQSIRALEQRLGVRLLNRSSRSSALSEAGRAFFAEVEPSLTHVEQAMQALRTSSARPAGRLRINLSRLAAHALVMPRLPEFVARYPEVDVELYADDTLADVVGGGFDAGIRFGQTLARDMVALPIDRGQYMRVVASPDYLRRRGIPRTPADLAHHDGIHFRYPGNGRLAPWQFVDDGRELTVEVPARLIFTDDRLGRMATRQGLGLSLQFESMVREDLAAGRLVSVLDAYAFRRQPFYIYYPAREHLPPKLRVFVDFLREPLQGGAANGVVDDDGA